MARALPRFRIKNFEIDNYRSLTAFVVDHLQNVNLIIGKNSSGKTSIMRALELALNVLVHAA